MTGELLVVDGLKKSYVDAYTQEEVVAIDGLSFSVGEGELVAILGPSGCGKTTVLNIIAGFVELTEGSVLLRGKPIREPGPDRGVVFQSFALFPWKTVLANVAFGLKMRGAGRREREGIAREYLELVGLRGFENKYPHELSGGMQQRVGVARVLANEPDVMLMDEPFASVDAQTRMKLQEDLTRIWEERHPTIFFVTHDVEEAVFLSDRVIVLTPRPGRVRQIVDIEIRRPRVWRRLVDDDSFRRTTQDIIDLLGEERDDRRPVAP
ncbi:MAG TPA: ABC transporter ATP-binding protein [Actinomycetota bacterium]|nr:ABC transporter ATP-binding protein [Actinomycetota bacterium]